VSISPDPPAVVHLVVCECFLVFSRVSIFCTGGGEQGRKRATRRLRILHGITYTAHRRIAEKVAEKRKEGTLGRPNKADGNRQERRLKKKAGEGVQATTPPPAKASGAPDADKAKKGAEQAGGGGGGLLDKIKNSELFKEADQMGRAQAIQVWPANCC
jgi:hypothetical protein